MNNLKSAIDAGMIVHDVDLRKWGLHAKNITGFADTRFEYKVNFILLSRAKYIFPVFSGCYHAHLEMFCIIISYCGVVYPPKIFLIKLKK